MQQILVIDDDVELCELVAEYLEPDGYKVEAVHDGEVGLERALSGEHVLAVLDYMLPGMNGFEVLRQIRSRSRLPVVMLTARGDDVNRIIGLQIGADDYLPKPFNPLEERPQRRLSISFENLNGCLGKNSERLRHRTGPASLEAPLVENAGSKRGDVYEHHCQSEPQKDF